MENLILKELTTRDEIIAAYSIINQVYSEMSLEQYLIYIDEMVARSDYKMIGAFLDNKLVGVSGYQVLLMIYCGRYIQLSNLVVDQNHRGLKIGTKIIHHIEEIGRQLKCEKVILESYTENKRSHSLYYQEDFHIRGFHFMKSL
jgi:GNAT superfamily N-acetyltransferase